MSLILVNRIFLLFIMIAGFFSCSNDYDYSVSEPLYKKAITDNWSAELVESGQNIAWAKREVILEENLSSFEALGLQINFFGDYLVYWDNVLIGRNGTPSEENINNKTSEVDRLFLVPDSLSTLGLHEVKIQFSRQLVPKSDRSFNLIIGPYKKLVAFPLKQSALASLFAGAFLIGGIYFLILYLSESKIYETLLFSLSCFLFFFLILLEYIKFYIPIHYTDFYLRLEMVSLFTFLISVTIPFFFSLQYELPKKRVFIGSYLLLLTLLYIIPFGSYDFSARMFAIAMWGFLFLISVVGIFRKATGAGVIFLGLILTALVDVFLVFDLSLFMGFMFILLAMFYIVLGKMKLRRRAYEASLVQSERLRNELLKKNIQPHFLLNTLTSLIDWIEESPERGVQMIEALAEEFRLLNEIEQKSLIALRAEIRLCRTHLEVMRFRKEVNYKWEEEIQNDQIKIPPAILHTLLENGITHCHPGKDNSLMFRLECRNSSKEILLTFRTFGELRKKNCDPVEGTGIKYIKSRLTESFGNAWEFTSTRMEDGWENNIKIWNYEGTNS